MTSFWCFCGLVGLPQYQGKCERHRLKEAPKKKEKIAKYRGDSKWGKENGFFETK